MNKKRSLKQVILFTLIFTIIFVPVVIGTLSIINMYKMKIESLKHNQKQELFQVHLETINFLQEIENISKYISDDYKNNTALLKNIVNINNDITSILILDNNGHLKDFYTSGGLTLYKGYDFSRKDYFRKIKEDKDFFWSDIFLSNLDESESLSYSFKLENAVGVIFLKPRMLSLFVKKFINSDGSHMIRMYDDNGILILNADESYLQAQRVNVSNHSVFKDLIKKVGPLEQAIYKVHNSERSDYGMYIQVKPTGWYIVVREDYSNFVNEITKLIVFIIIFVVLFIFLFLIFITNFLNRIFSSIDNLESSTLSIANGKYNTKIESSTFSEFNSFIDSLKNMQHEIKKREISLKKSVNSFKSLVDSTMESILLHKDGVCTDVNFVTVKLFGYENKNEMISKNVIDFIATDSKNIFYKEVKNSKEPIEIKMKKANGKTFSALIQEKKIELNDEILTIMTIIDITELKNKDKLLAQQAKMAAMGEMIGNIAHQWRQPLSTISTAATGMKIQKELEQLDNDTFHKSIDAIVGSTKYLSKTIDDFRNFFKSDKKRGEFNISSVIENTLSLIETTLKNKFITIKVEQKGDIELYGFESELLQVIVNIINNASDALMLEKNASLDEKIIILNVSKKNNHAIIKIKDNGGGIKEEVLPKIFEPYFTTKHKSQGTGIGLYMSHQIICNNMNGILRADNKEFTYKDKKYKGAQFTIVLELFKKNKNDYMI